MTLRRSLAAAAAVVATAFAGVGAAAAAPRPLGLIIIPRIGLDVPFYNGQAAAIVNRGPAHYPWSGMPGQGRTVAIAGHRVTHTHPFLLLGDLRKGDEVELRYGPRFRRRACYRVSGSRVVPPTDVRVTDDVGHERLVLTTCTPPGTATYRLVVFARRVGACA